MFKLNDRVQTPLGKGYIIDVFTSSTGTERHYKVEHIDDYGSICMYAEDELSHYVPPIESGESITIENLEFRAQLADDVVVMTIIENGKEIARGHGHVIHEGKNGIIQAFSWAGKKAWDSVGFVPTYKSDRSYRDYNSRDYNRG